MPPTLQTIWEATIRRHPDAAALIEAESGKTWTRAELNAEALDWNDPRSKTADLSGRIVVFALPNGVEWWRVFLGLISAGAVPAPLDPGESVDHLRRTAQSIGAAWIWQAGKLEPVGSADKSRRTHTHALLKITSGSTGTPQAFRFTAAQMLADSRQICSSMGIAPSDINLAVIPLGHSYGLGNLVLPLIEQGTAIVCTSSALPQSLANVCRQWRPSVFPAVPALLRLLANSDIPATHFESLRLVISAGATLPPATAQAFHEKFQRKVHGFYGSSETGGICYDRSGEASLRGRSVGAPLDGVSLTFRRGQRFTVTSPAVVKSSGFSPADRAELNEFGELVLLGRTGRMIKLAGRRLDPGEIETTMRTIPGVRDAMVAAHPHRPDALAAIVATGLDKPRLREAITSRLPAWKVPTRLIIVASFPLTPRGKTDTHSLLKQLAHA